MFLKSYFYDRMTIVGKHDRSIRFADNGIQVEGFLTIAHYVMHVLELSISICLIYIYASLTFSPFTMKAVVVTLLALVCVVGLTLADWGTSSYYYPQSSNNSIGGCKNSFLYLYISIRQR